MEGNGIIMSKETDVGNLKGDVKMEKENFKQNRNLLIRKHDYQVAIFNKLYEIVASDENVTFDIEELIKRYSGEILKYTERSGHINFKWNKEEL